MRTYKAFNAAGYDRRGKIRTKEQNPANLIPSVMEVAAGKRNKLLVFGNDFETIDGTGVRDYIHVTDLARAHLLAFDLISRHNSAINLGSERQYSVLEVIKKLARKNFWKINSF